MPALEARLERQFSQAIRAKGGMAVKLVPTIAGIPDRLVIWNDGTFSLVELKTSIGPLRAIQVLRHKQLKAMGHTVVVLRGEDQIQSWIDDMTLEK